jgi:uncharacterized protein YggE
MSPLNGGVLVLGSKRPVGLIAVGAVVLAAALFPSSVLAQAPATTLTSSGLGQSATEPDNPHSETSIREAVEAAEAAALPKALTDARTHAAALAAAAGVTLGPLLSISDAPANAFPFYYQLGTFPNGHYCGNVRRTKTVVRNGVRRRVSAGTSRVCRVPPQVFASVQLTFAVGPPPS